MDRSTFLTLTALLVCRELSISRAELIGKRREGIAARALFVWLIRERSAGALTFSEIGRWLGDRDHQTTGYLYRVVAPRLRVSDHHFSQLCERFSNKETITCQ